MLQTFIFMTSNSSNFDKDLYDAMQDVVIAMVNGSNGQSVMQATMYDRNFVDQFYGLQANILLVLRALLDSAQIVNSNSLVDQPPTKDAAVSNITRKLRDILYLHEALVSTWIYEGTTFYHENQAFYAKIQKFSRLGNTMTDQAEVFPSGSFTSYDFPLGNATQPTERQSFAVYNFRVSPFTGDYYLN